MTRPEDQVFRIPGLNGAIAVVKSTPNLVLIQQVTWDKESGLNYRILKRFILKSF